MIDKKSKALRNLKVGGIYTPIIFGVIFVSMNSMLKSFDPSGDLAQKFSNLPFYSPPSTAIGGMLIFFGVNTLIYFYQYLREIEKSEIEIKETETD
jgi:hypothetical protein